KPGSYVTCTCHSHNTICGQDIFPGYPPDKPSNLTCMRNKTSKKITCTWDTGKATYIETVYMLHLENTEVERMKNYLISSYFVKVSVSSTITDIEYQIWVQAQNTLGTKKSDILKFNINDIVIPDTPTIINVEFVNSSVSETKVHLKKAPSTEKHYFQLRYRQNTSHVWSVEKKIGTDLTWNLSSLGTLQPHAEYEFQVCCRQVNGKGYWSEWSASLKEKTPEAGT
uniref:Fibronectin type-III domain-containing protein n=1 Tax=Latimeria chalumnae TaxID=7897 RepID=H3ALH5_LATCH